MQTFKTRNKNYVGKNSNDTYQCNDLNIVFLENIKRKNDRVCLFLCHPIEIETNDCLMCRYSNIRNISGNKHCPLQISIGNWSHTHTNKVFSQTGQQNRFKILIVAAIFSGVAGWNLKLSHKYISTNFIHSKCLLLSGNMSSEYYSRIFEAVFLVGLYGTSHKTYYPGYENSSCQRIRTMAQALFNSCSKFPLYTLNSSSHLSRIA